MAARLLGLPVRIPPETSISVSCECFCFKVEVSTMGRSLVQRSPTECVVSVCDCEASIMRRLWPIRARAMVKKKNPLRPVVFIHYACAFLCRMLRLMVLGFDPLNLAALLVLPVLIFLTEYYLSWGTRKSRQSRESQPRLSIVVKSCWIMCPLL